MPKANAQRLTIDETGTLLKVLSKLHRVTVVNDSPFFRPRFPHICWMDAESFHPVNSLLTRYPGKGRWYVLHQPPRACLVAEPDIRKGDPIPVPDGPDAVRLSDIERARGELERRGVQLPALTMTSPGEFRARIIREIPELAAYLEDAFSLLDKPFLGVETSSENLELPFMEDRRGPGNGVVLSADPSKYASTGFSTSPYDRYLHFWITDSEADEMSSELRRIENDDRESTADFSILAKVSGARYGGLVVTPTEMSRLANESERVKNETNNVRLKDALDRIASVCRSAQSYSLGIYVSGE